ncbi:MAG: hypothetical protein ACXWEW_11330 [Nitrososphaeraceae archaeon]
MTTLGQDYLTRNKQKINDVINNGMHICINDITYPTRYKKSKLRKELAFIQTIKSGLAGYKKFSEIKTKNKKQIRSTQRFDNGLLQSEEILIIGPYLRYNIRVDYIDTFLVHQRINFVTRTKGSCDSYRDIISDFQFIRNFVLPNLSYDLDFTLNDIVLDTLYSSNVQKASFIYKDHQFQLPSIEYDAWLNQFLEDQYKSESSCCYQNKIAPSGLIKMIKIKDYSIINKLLYSANYFTAINAMEALVYLDYKGEIELKAEDKERIEFLKKSKIKITKQMGSDVFVIMNDYIELMITEDRIIKKYEISLK